MVFSRFIYNSSISHTYMFFKKIIVFRKDVIDTTGESFIMSISMIPLKWLYYGYPLDFLACCFLNLTSVKSSIVSVENIFLGSLVNSYLIHFLIDILSPILLCLSLYLTLVWLNFCWYLFICRFCFGVFIELLLNLFTCGNLILDVWYCWVFMFVFYDLFCWWLI